MHTTHQHDEKIARLIFATVYVCYQAKLERAGVGASDLNALITWLTGFDDRAIQALLQERVSFEVFFERAHLHPCAHLITGMICGYRVEDIQNPLTQKVRYLDKMVDEFAKGKPLQKIFRTA